MTDTITPWHERKLNYALEYPREAAMEAEIAQLRAALAQQAEQGWQPIETAPKNGTEILMYSPPLKNFSVRYRNTRIGWYVLGMMDADDYWGTEVFFNGRSIVQILHNATHWMPLPAAPKGGV